jgi:LuxR family maltose regulon positive regulatory protein
LIARIEQSDARIALLCAPAGFGKTTLMQQLRRELQAQGMATVWLRLDSGDNALGRFLQSLLAAIQLAMPQFVPPDFASTPLGPAGTTQGLAADLLDRIALSELPVALFLDELELITAAETGEFLQRLLADLGPHHRVVMGSRTPPPLSLGRLRAHGLLLDLTHTDLRFTPEETTSFVTRRGMPPAAALQLQRRTEGWPAALQLAAITFGAKGKSAAEWLERYSGSTESVADYLAQEVLASRPLPQRGFLLNSSVLGDFCAPMCDAALSRDDSAAMIAQVLRDNLLLSSIEVEQGWYRYHPLFADFLRAQLEREAPGKAQALHRAAALWAGGKGLTHEAVTHALAAQDTALAASVFESSALGLVRSGRVAEAARIVAQLPDAEVIRRPALLRAGAFAAIFAHRYSAATRFIELLERAADTGERPADGELFAMRLMLLAWTDRIPEMYERVSHNLDASHLDAFNMGLSSNASAFCSIALGRHVEAERDLARARQACEPIHALYVLSYSACFSAQIELIRGNTAQARQILETAMNRAIAAGQRHGSAGAVVATHLAELRYEANELDACEVLVNDYLPIVIETGLPDHLIMMHRLGARLHYHFGRPEAGYALLADLHELGVQRRIARLRAASWLERVYVALRGNDRQEARRSLALGADASIWESFGQFQLYASDIEDPLIARIRLDLVLGVGTETVPLLQTALRESEAACRQRRALRLSFLLAQTLESSGRRGEAIAAFDDAITRASALGLMRCLADDNWSTRSLVRRTSAAGEARAAALLRELDSRRDPAVQATGNALPSGTPAQVSRLSNRELQVLRLLGRGNSNKVIARELFLSENTIETHLRRIYEKLGTHNRTEAAALAREAGAI